MKARVKEYAKNVIDSMFERRIFKDEITRSDMDDYEEYLVSVLELEYDSMERLISFAKKWDDKRKNEKKV